MKDVDGRLKTARRMYLKSWYANERFISDSCGMRTDELLARQSR